MQDKSRAPFASNNPEPNIEGLALARAHGLTEVFGCARLYLGPNPDLPNARIFGVTSFEFG